MVKISQNFFYRFIVFLNFRFYHFSMLIVLLISSCAYHRTVKTPDAPQWNQKIIPWWKKIGDAQLDSLINLALDQAPSLDQVDARVQRMKLNVKAFQRQNFLPHIGIDQSFTRFDKSSPISTPMGNFPPFHADILSLQTSISYAVDVWGTMHARLKAMQHQIHHADAMAQMSRIWLSTSIANLYVQWVNAQHHIQYLNKCIQLIQKQCDLVKHQQKFGLLNASVLHNIQIQKQQITSHITMMQNASSAFIHQLACLIGQHHLSLKIPLQHWVHRAQNIELNALNDDYDDSLFVEHHPEMQAVKALKKMMDYQAKAIQTSRYPQLNFNAGMGQHVVRHLGDILSRGAFFSLFSQSLNATLFDFGTHEAYRQESQWAIREAQAAHDAKYFQIFHDAHQTVKKFNSLQIRLKQTLQQCAHASSLERLARIQFKRGLHSRMHLIDAELTSREFHNTAAHHATEVMLAYIEGVRTQNLMFQHEHN